MSSEQVPIFESGLFGKANSIVCNSWTDAARIVADNAEGIRWAQSQVVSGHVTTRFLAKITTATPMNMGAGVLSNRWVYAGTAFKITPLNATMVPAGDFGKFVDAVNIRELRNSSTQADGSPLVNASIGPVGSSYVNGSWTLEQLAGYVELVADYDSNGGLKYWFDCPNPSACTNAGGGGGGG